MIILEQLRAWFEQLFPGDFVTFLSEINLVGILQNTLYVIFILLATYLLLRVRYKVITRAFRYTRLDENKKGTLISLLMSTTKYIIFIIAIFLIITVFIPMKQIAPILAGAGVVGLAIGFGAQSLVKDIITGFFIMFEDQFHVGDYIEVNNNAIGTVEEMGMRITTLREWSGKKFYIANSEIKTVRNYNRKEMRAIVSATFPYHESPQKIRALLQEVCQEIEAKHSEQLLKDNKGEYVEPPQILGVTDINDNQRGGTYTIIAKTLPPYLWTVERSIRETIWQKCHEKGVELAYPRRVLENAHIYEYDLHNESN